MVGSPLGSSRTFHSWWSLSKISPTYPWKIPRTFHQQFMKEFLSLWGFGEVWGIFPGYVGKIIEFGIELLPQVCGLLSGCLFVYFFVSRTSKWNKSSKHEDVFFLFWGLHDAESGDSSLGFGGGK